MQHLKPNSTLQGGKYRIDKTLGQGSFGITYLATHTSLERKVAIKEFFMKELNSRGNDGSITGMSDGSLSYNYGQKFKKEALNLSRLDHPNIVRVTDSFDENGTYYYVMDYIEGENLNDYLKHTAVSQKEAIDIITAVAKALQYMHDTKHMLHLDLKPGNIMRRASDGHIFLIDFGLSKHFSNSGQPETSTTIGLGTPGYAPIEQSNQAKNGEFRPTIDVYALGATLFKLLTRETPPPASDIVSDDELIEDKLRANGITGNIIDVVVNAMLPNVRKRTQSVGAFVESFRSNNTAPNTTSKTNAKVQDEETLVVGASTSKDEETIITPSVALHPVRGISETFTQSNDQVHTQNVSSTQDKNAYSNKKFVERELGWLISELVIGIIGYVIISTLFNNMNSMDELRCLPSASVIAGTILYWVWPAGLSACVFLVTFLKNDIRNPFVYDTTDVNLDYNPYPGVSAVKSGCLSMIIIILGVFILAYTLLSTI